MVIDPLAKIDLSTPVRSVAGAVSARIDSENEANIALASFDLLVVWRTQHVFIDRPLVDPLDLESDAIPVHSDHQGSPSI